MDKMNMTVTLDDILNTSQRKDFPLEDGPVLLIDSDTICFRAAAATDGRQYNVGKMMFKYKADAIKYCKERDIPIKEIESDYFPEPKAHALQIVKGALSDVKEYADQCYPRYSMEFFHTSSENFRNELLPTYKANRVDTRRPYHLDNCKDYIRKLYSTFEKSGMEADDLIGIRAYQLRAQGREYIIVSNDKDLKTIPGIHWDWVKKEKTSSSTVEAMKFFYAQCIAGDTADNIPGVDGLSINNKGTGKAQKIIQNAHEYWAENEITGEVTLEMFLYETVLGAWLSGGPGKWAKVGCVPYDEVVEQVRQSAQCLYILHDEGILWEPPTKSRGNF